jgi:hypothetical protein
LRGDLLRPNLHAVEVRSGGLWPPDGGDLPRLAGYEDGSEAPCLMAGAFCVALASSSLLQGLCTQPW